MGLFSGKKKNEKQVQSTIEGSTVPAAVTGFNEEDINMFSILTILLTNRLREVNQTETALKTAEMLDIANNHFENGKLSEMDLHLAQYYFKNVDPNLFETNTREEYFSLLKKLDKTKIKYSEKPQKISGFSDEEKGLFKVLADALADYLRGLGNADERAQLIESANRHFQNDQLTQKELDEVIYCFSKMVDVDKQSASVVPVFNRLMEKLEKTAI